MQEIHLPDVLAIYNQEIRTGVATLDLTEQTLAQKTAWFQKNKISFPHLVAIQNEEIVGFCYLSSFREKEACNQTAELTLYIRPDRQGNGIGTKLLKVLIDRAQKGNFHTLISVITGGNDASIQLHKKFNFQFCGELKEIGFKQDRWLSISFYQKHLGK